MVVMLFFLMQAALVFKGFFALSADEAGHTLEGYSWFKGKYSLFSIWLPYQKIIYGLAFHIYNNLFIVPRIISSIFGLLTLISLMFLTSQLFQIKIVTILAGFLGAIFWGIVIFSVLPMNEIYLCFFTLISISFLVRWQRNNFSSSFWLAIIFATISSTIRYEAWVFSGVMFLVICVFILNSNATLSSKLIKIIMCFILLSLIPFAWIYLSYNSTGRILGFIQLVAERYNVEDLNYKIKSNVIFAFFNINYITLNIIGLLTLYFLRKDQIIRSYLFILFSTLITTGILTFISNAMPTHNPWRLATIWSILLIPLTAFVCYRLYTLKSKFTKFSFIILMIILTYIFIKQINEYTTLSYMTREDLSIGNYIEISVLNNNDVSKIFIQENSWEYTNLLVSSNNPDEFIPENIFSHDLSFSSIPYYNDLLDKLRFNKINYIILKPYNEDYFDLNKLRLIKRFNNWVIYKLE